MMEKYRDSSLSPQERAEDLIKRMDVKEKMAQLNCYLPQRSDVEAVAQACPNGIGQISCLEMRSMESLEETAAFQRRTQEIVLSNSRHGIPAIFHMEGLCGAFIQGATSFPSGIGRASSWNPELEQKVGEIVARQERTIGITHTFAPVLDISRDSRMGRQGECYGEDPTLAASLGTAFTRGIQSGETRGLKSEAVAKHFLGFHNSQGGIHGAHCDIPVRLLEEIYAKPFQAAISEAGLRGIMPCYGSINGEPVSASEGILTKLLREEMGFDGVTVSDYCAVMNIHGVQQVCESYTDAGQRALEAGMDMELHFMKCFNPELEKRFEEGQADMQVLDRAVLRVLTAKFRMGLFESPFAPEGLQLRAGFVEPQDQQVSLQSALESIIMLKNDGILPLDQPLRKIAVIGSQANDARIFFGGYTHLSMAEGIKAAENSMAGVSLSKDRERVALVTLQGTPIQRDDAPEFEAVLKLQKPECKNLLQQLRESMPGTEVVYAYGYPIAGDDMSGYAEALKAAEDAQLIVLTLGGKHGTSSIASMGEGVDSTDINLPICQERFIQEAVKLNKPMVGIHFNGRPISSDAADQHLNAILEAWNPAEMGAQAVVEVLLGKYNPSGKLPVSVAYNAGQIPIYYNHPNGSAYHQGESIGFPNYVDVPHTPRYFFGHGLSYTSFEYSRISIDREVVEPDGQVIIAFDIENTGRREGVEIAQLYLRDRFASMTRPFMELGGFARVALKPGEKKHIGFKVSPSLMAFLDKDMRWKVEAGEIDVFVGTSSQELKLNGSFKVREDLYVEGKKRAFWAEYMTF